MPTKMTDPRAARQFFFVSRSYDPLDGVARLSYRFDDGPELIEQFEFPYAPWPPDASRQAAFERALDLLHWIAGVSYYKAGLSREIVFATSEPTPEIRQFLQTLYIEGLAEFAHVNRLTLRDRVRFATFGGDAKAHPLVLPERALVAMGGGKDSLVGLELLLRAEVEAQPACVGGSKLIAETVRAASLPLIRIQRTLAPELSEMNRAGAWNGHVPVTAINSAVLLCAAILYGYRYIVFSNERSADEATLVGQDGNPVNHQYSKSSAFELQFRDIVHSQISPAIDYFSILRPFSELEIVRRFSQMERYHQVYSSCNRNFHLDGSKIEGRWCLDCPKCRFAALSLALNLSPEQVRGIMGGDLLDHRAQLDGFRALCGLGAGKPFECVGETGESRAALLSLADRPEWKNHAVIRALLPELESVEVPRLEDLLTVSERHFIPPNIRRRIDAVPESDDPPAVC